MVGGSISTKTALFRIFLCIILLLPQFYHVKSSNLAEATTSSSEKVVSIMAVGDSIGYNIENENLSNLSSIIINNSTDIFIFNLEGVLADPSLNDDYPSIECKGFPSVQSTFVSDSTFIDYLKLAPITVANLANNHILDCGAEGINETKKVLKEKNILSVGAGQDLQEACEPLLVQQKGLRIAFVSYNFVLEDLVSAQANRAGGASMHACSHDYNNNIRLQKGADLIIASIHLGYWSPYVNEEQVKVVQHLFDSGIDMIIGHSPHMPQAVAATKAGNLAFFSLGNFILRPDYGMPPLAHTTIVPKIDIYADNTVNVTIYPVRIDNDGIPHLEEKSDNNEIISRIAKDSDRFYTSLKIHDNLGLLSIKRYSEWLC